MQHTNPDETLSALCPPVNLPLGRLPEVRPAGDGWEIRDPLRRRWLVLTPEEWVRQTFTIYLADTLGVPATMTANEVGIHLNGTLKRCDTVIYDRRLKPLAIVEYKAPHVAITRQVFEQILRYNIVLGVKYVIVSNGMRTLCASVSPEGKCSLLGSIPDYDTMCGE